MMWQECKDMLVDWIGSWGNVVAGLAIFIGFPALLFVLEHVRDFTRFQWFLVLGGAMVVVGAGAIVVEMTRPVRERRRQQRQDSLLAGLPAPSRTQAP